jgi:hypothetical protein
MDVGATGSSQVSIEQDDHTFIDRTIDGESYEPLTSDKVHLDVD